MVVLKDLESIMIYVHPPRLAWLLHATPRKMPSQKEYYCRLPSTIVIWGHVGVRFVDHFHSAKVGTIANLGIQVATPLPSEARWLLQLWWVFFAKKTHWLVRFHITGRSLAWCYCHGQADHLLHAAAPCEFGLCGEGEGDVFGWGSDFSSERAESTERAEIRKSSSGIVFCGSLGRLELKQGSCTN